MVDAEDEYLRNMRKVSKQLRLDPSALQGMPEDYLSNHSVDPSTGKYHLLNKLTDTVPALEHCQIQATREKVLRFMHGLASPQLTNRYFSVSLICQDGRQSCWDTQTGRNTRWRDRW